MAGVSTLGQALDQIERIKSQQSLLDQLSLQATSGKKTQTFSGLGQDALTSQRARADLNSYVTYDSNITNANRHVTLASGALSQFKTQAQSFLNALVEFSQQGAHQEGDQIRYDDPLTAATENTYVGQTSAQPDSSITTLQHLASNLYDFLTQLVNTQDGSSYVFAGADTSTKPLNDTGTLDSAVNNLITQWKAGTITTDELTADLQQNAVSAAAPNAITDTTVGYSPSLSAGTAGNVFVRVDKSSEIDYTTLGNDPSIRNILVTLAYFKNGNLPPVVDAYTPPNTYPGAPDAKGAPGATAADQEASFYQVFNSLTATVTQAVNNIDKLTNKLGTAQARITDIQTAQKQQQNVLQTTISNVENADINEVAVKINALQTQLQASYSVTATLQKYSLVNFLSGGFSG